MTRAQKSIFIAEAYLQPYARVVGLTLCFGSMLVLTQLQPRQQPGWAVLSLGVGALGAALVASPLSVQLLSHHWVLALAFWLRLLAFAIPVGFSDDLFRYIWEGWVGLHGINPLQVPPASPSLDGLSIPVRALVNHPELSSVYPPLAQLGFQLLAWLDPSVGCFRSAAFLIELALLGCLSYHVVSRQLPRHGLYFYALHPLPMVELIASAHVDGAALLLTVMALTLGHASRPRALAGACLLLAAGMVKVLPWVLLPSLLIKSGRSFGWRFVLLQGTSLLLLTGGLCLPFLSDPTAVLSGLSTYATHWEFNPSLFRLLRLGMEPETARRAVQLLFVAGVLWESRPGVPLEQLARRAFLSFFLLSPTAHPWYFVWTLVLLPLSPSPRLAVKVLSISVGASYWVFSGPNGWGEPAWLWMVVYMPPLLTLFWEGWQVRR